MSFLARLGEFLGAVFVGLPAIVAAIVLSVIGLRLKKGRLIYLAIALSLLPLLCASLGDAPLQYMAPLAIVSLIAAAFVLRRGAMRTAALLVIVPLLAIILVFVEWLLRQWRLGGI